MQRFMDILVKHYRVTGIVVGHFWNQCFNRISWIENTGFLAQLFKE